MKTQQYFYFIKDLSIRGQKLNNEDAQKLFEMQQEYKQHHNQQLEEAKRIKLNQHRRESLKKYILGE